MNEPTCNRMPLLAPELRWRLLENGRQSGGGHVLVVKFFNPVGIGAWHSRELCKVRAQAFVDQELHEAAGKSSRLTVRADFADAVRQTGFTGGRPRRG